MVVPGSFTPPAMARNHEPYPAVGDGSIEVDGMTVKITARDLAMPWITYLLGAIGLVIGFLLMIIVSGFAIRKLSAFIVLGPAIGGFALGHFVRRSVGMNRPPQVGVFGLECVRSVNTARGLCEIVVEPYTAPLVITFVPVKPEDVEPLAATLRRGIRPR